MMVTTSWPDEAVEHAASRINAVGLETAARELGKSPPALRGALNRAGFSFKDGKAIPPTAPKGAVSVPAPEAPAWQGYAPRAAWSAPEPTRTAKAKAHETIVSIVLADLHKPYSSKPDLACAKGIIREVKPARVHLDGDVMEMEALSRHPKSKPDLTRLSEEYYETNVELDDLQNQAPDADWYYEQGNHEARADRFACEYGTLDGMLSVPESLYITPRAEYHRETSQLRGMRWIPLSMQPFVLGEVAYLHGVFESKHHAQANAESLAPRSRAQVTISGHMHGFQAAESAAGFRAYACPWLGDERAAVFRAYVKGKPKPWSKGLLIVEESGNLVTVTHVPIVNGRALAFGRIVAA